MLRKGQWDKLRLNKWALRRSKPGIKWALSTQGRNRLRIRLMLLGRKSLLRDSGQHRLLSMLRLQNIRLISLNPSHLRVVVMPTADDFARALRGPVDPNKMGSNVPSSDYYWPNDQDVALSKKYDTLYGSPNAPYATPGAANVQTAPAQGAMDWHQGYNKAFFGNPVTPPGSTSSINTEADADRLRAESIAAERSAMAKLGHDPGLSYSTPIGNGQLPIAGGYNQNSNISWYNQASPAAAIHESMHRGMQKLREGGQLPIGKPQEEAYVRALMQRIYGNV